MGVKYAINSKFFSKLDSVRAYVLGFFYADGSMHISERGRYVTITSTDKPIIFKIKKWMESKHFITVARSTWENGKDRYVLRMGNKELYNSLLKIGLYPNKSLTIDMPIIPNKFMKDFVRGYFDGDGCVYLYRSKGIKKKIILRKLSVIFTSGSKKFLESLLAILKSKISLQQRKVYLGHRSFQLRLSTSDSVRMFKFMYSNTDKELFFNRKFNIFREYFYRRPQRIDNVIKNILQFASQGHVAKK